MYKKYAFPDLFPPYPQGVQQNVDFIEKKIHSQKTFMKVSSSFLVICSCNQFYFHKMGFIVKCSINIYYT